MKRLLVGGIAAIAIGLSVAPVANAAPYTSADMDFIAAVTDLGYYGDKDRLIKTGHVVCELLDDGVDAETAKANVIPHHGGGSYVANPSFNATLFVQYAAINYCPWQPAAKWNI